MSHQSEISQIIGFMGGHCDPRTQEIIFPNGARVSNLELFHCRSTTDAIRHINAVIALRDETIKAEKENYRGPVRCVYMDRNYEIVREEVSYFVPDAEHRAGGPWYYLEEHDGDQALYLERER